MPEQNFRDPLADLRQRLEDTRLAAEQLADDVADARAAESAGDDPPPPRAEQERLRDDLAAMAGLVQAIADLVPADLREQVYEILRQILLLLRALIDWLVDRLPPVRAGQPAVEDIPVA
jgi:hypothetical protein